MISVLQAQELIDEHVNPLGSETVSLAEAYNRILNEPVAAPEELPPFDRSAMDGYAVLHDDGADVFTVVTEIRAGQAIAREIKPGEAIRVLTGARMPGPGLKVVLQEHVEFRDNRIHLTKRSPASNVRLRGEDAHAGEILLQPGTALDATALALLATLGETTPRVMKQPAILHLTTGDEIVPPGQTPEPGQIRNSNASLIASLCREQSVESVRHFHAPDDLPTLLKILADAKAESFDMILISGGSGSGTYDFSAELFRHLGAMIHFREVNVRPGKPLIFGVNGTRVAFGLPGNPLAHFVCLNFAVATAIACLRGETPPTFLRGPLATALADDPCPRETLWPGRVLRTTESTQLQPLPWASSGDMTCLALANALLRIPANTTALEAGAEVEYLPALGRLES